MWGINREENMELRWLNKITGGTEIDPIRTKVLQEFVQTGIDPATRCEVWQWQDIETVIAEYPPNYYNLTRMR